MIILRKQPEHFFEATGVQLADLTLTEANRLCQGAIVSIVQAEGNLPFVPPFEVHPYLSIMPMQQWDKYFIGTFPPISYALDHPALVAGGVFLLTKPGVGTISRPKLPFFHGNKLTFWKTLMLPVQYTDLLARPRLLQRQIIIDFLTEIKVNYSDVIRYTQRTGNYNANDSAIVNIVINDDLLDHTLRNPHPTLLIFNSSSTFGSAGLSVHVYDNNQVLAGRVNVRSVKAFDLFARAWQERGAQIFLRINRNNNWIEITSENANLLANTFRNKVCFEMKIIYPGNGESGGEKIFTIVTPPSISSQTNRALPRNKNFRNWLIQNPGATVTEFIRAIYQAALSNDIQTLNRFNFHEISF